MMEISTQMVRPVSLALFFQLTLFYQLAAALPFVSSQAAENFADREEVQAFVKELVADEAFDEAQLLNDFRLAKRQQRVIDLISRPAEKTHNWDSYQDIFLTEERRRKGEEFMRQNEAALQAAYETYGVPPEIVAAIIGVETMYGQITGRYRVLDALATLSFDYPPRAKFFRRELKQFFLLSREEERQATSLLGSYAGAMGLGQFIPSSYRRWAVDFDGDGSRDIWNNPKDAIGSVAYYLGDHGWQRDQLITLKVDGSNLPEDIFNTTLRLSTTVAELRRLGLADDSLPPGSEKVAPMRLEGKEGDEHWLALKNFYVITRYNRSRLYAMAVFQLSERLRPADGSAVGR